jgi:hypothetical protein
VLGVTGSWGYPAYHAAAEREEGHREEGGALLAPFREVQCARGWSTILSRNADSRARV